MLDKVLVLDRVIGPFSELSCAEGDVGLGRWAHGKSGVRDAGGEVIFSGGGWSMMLLVSGIGGESCGDWD